MNVENTFYMGKKGMHPLETGEDAAVKNTKEEDIEDESERTASLTLSELKQITTCKLVEAINPFCFICEMSLKTLEEKHE